MTCLVNPTLYFTSYQHTAVFSIFLSRFFSIFLFFYIPFYILIFLYSFLDAYFSRTLYIFLFLYIPFFIPIYFLWSYFSIFPSVFVFSIFYIPKYISIFRPLNQDQNLDVDHIHAYLWTMCAKEQRLFTGWLKLNTNYQIFDLAMRTIDNGWVQTGKQGYIIFP